MLKILITGGAGYLGSVLTERMLIDHQVTVIDRFMHRQNSLGHLCYHPKLEIVRGDVRDIGAMKPLIAKADVIFPLAALVGAPLCAEDPLTAESTNFDAIQLICNMVSSNQLLVIPTTNSGYGIGEPDKECTEDSPLRPLTLYGKLKVEAEDLVLEHGGISLRLATLFGMSPRMRLDLLVNNFVYRAVMDRALVLFEGGFCRNYLHVRDAANAFSRVLIRALNHSPTVKDTMNSDSFEHRIFNVGLSDANLSKRQLCERIKLQLPKFVWMEAPIGEDLDKRDYIVSNARIESYLGFKPSFTLDQGITELIKGYAMLRNSRYGNV